MKRSSWLRSVLGLAFGVLAGLAGGLFLSWLMAKLFLGMERYESVLPAVGWVLSVLSALIGALVCYLVTGRSLWLPVWCAGLLFFVRLGIGVWFFPGGIGWARVLLQGALGVLAGWGLCLFVGRSKNSRSAGKKRRRRRIQR